MSVKNNNINVHNPNINLPGSLSKAITGIGVGGAVAGGMTAVSHFAKSSSMPLGVKIGATAAGGAIAGCLFVVTNATNTLIQRKVEDKTSSPRPSNNSSNDSYTASSVLEDS